MDVQAAQTRRVQHRLRQDQPIGDHHRHIGPQRGEIRLFGRIAQPRRGAHRQAHCLGRRVHRRKARLLPAPGGAGRPGIDRDDLVIPGQRAQRRDRKFRRSHEDDAHDPSPAAFRGFFFPETGVRSPH